MEDSEVFQEGTIGSNPAGGKLSTYKELCSLANEMGQPALQPHLHTLIPRLVRYQYDPDKNIQV